MSRTQHRRSWPLCVAALLSLAWGCGEEVGELALASPDRMEFELRVYPVLLRDCAFHACHGNGERFLQILGPGRGRLSPLTRPLDPRDPLEVEHSYQRARSMIDAKDPEASLLLRKPLAVAAGGAGHQGTDEHGRDVYDDALDARFAILSNWATAVSVGDAQGAATAPATPTVPTPPTPPVGN